jgi:hypothetical protein
MMASKDATRPTESIALDFSKLEFDYRPTKPDGSLGTEKSFKRDNSRGKSF